MEKTQHSNAYRKLTKALREAREAAGLTQGEVAKKLKVYASFVSKVESGERRIDVVELTRFCQIYNVELVAFLRKVGLVK